MRRQEGQLDLGTGYSAGRRAGPSVPQTAGRGGGGGGEGEVHIYRERKEIYIREKREGKDEERREELNNRV